ncbi:beta-lactamase regulating signal transducer with metallopeptidase domain [Arcticibacter pallidicorallinus]|uniref:Beta-lactamase regulating signal transducer with metallopeptidase domain n=1 Tax=Arcticibacter pallidicorallinus TaxID=1259464 RepID=A0A2T0U3V2_9SPHI|nr:M56 family metallopeptidase [Arcticibacter pallidicorallinus]PRY52583.1 beta-lactamase regulating signal transducer with metallopeptidase domain [Arcticibacter pallidicorallinus]
MGTSAFIEALTETLLISTAQAFAIVLFFRVMFGAVPDIPSAIKYRLWYSSLVLIFGLFIYTLFSLYHRKLEMDTVISAIQATQADTQQISWLEKVEAWKREYAKPIALLYFTGVVIQLLSLALAWFRTRSLGKGDPLLQDPVWLAKLNALSKKLGVVKHVTLHVSERIKVPLTAGFIKPVILLPVAMVSRLSPEQVESILLHELAHIKRLDYLWNMIQKVIESILFFNPFVWLIVKEINKEREYCCDEIVVSKTSDPLTYAKALLQLEVEVKCNELAMCANGNEKYPLLDRIKRVSGMTNPDPSPKTGLIVLATILCVGLSLAVALPQEEKDIVIVKNEKLSGKQQQTTVHSIEESISSADNDEGRPVLNKFLVRAATKANTICLEDATIGLHQDELRKHAEAVREHALLRAKHHASIRQHAEELKKHIEGQDLKDMQQELAKHSAAIAEAALDLQHLEELRLPPPPPELPKEQGKLHQQIEKLQRKFESPEWQAKHIALLRKVTNATRKVTSVDWGQTGEEISVHVEELVKGFDSLP